MFWAPVKLEASTKKEPMGEEQMEGGLRSELLEANSRTVEEDGNDSSSATAAVVFSTAVVVCGSFAFGCAQGFSAPTETGIMKDLNMSVAAYSVFGSIITVGAIVGSLVNGKLADTLGRKGTMWVAEFLFIIGWLAIAFAQAPWVLDVGRFFMGVAIGIITYATSVYIAEIAPTNIRGVLTTANQFMVLCGFSVTYFLGTVISWRFLTFIGAISCALHVVGLFFIPESPRWLAKLGREAELEATLQYLRGKNADISEEIADIRDYTTTLQGNEAGFLELFQRRYAHALIAGSGLFLLQQLVGMNGIAYYMASIFEKADFPSNVGLISVSIIELPGCALSVFLADKCGRRPLLLISASGMGLSCCLIGIAFSLHISSSTIEITSVLVFISLMGYTVFFALGISGLPWVVMSEILPINIKGTAGSLATLISWSSSLLVTSTFNFMMEWSSAGTFFILFAMCCVTALFVVKVVPETKGRSLEQVQASIAADTRRS